MSNEYDAMVGDQMERHIADLEAKLAEAVAEIGKLQGERESWVKEVGQYQSGLSKLHAKKFTRFNNEECWIYQDDEDDNLESLVCPVVISAEVLLKIERQLAEAVRTRQMSDDKCLELGASVTAMREQLAEAQERRTDMESELVQADGATPYLSVNILRHWSREKIEVFATHLLGDKYQDMAAKLADTQNDLTMRRMLYDVQSAQLEVALVRIAEALECAEAQAIEVDSGKCVLAQLWKDTGGIVPSTGKAWITGKQLRKTTGGKR